MIEHYSVLVCSATIAVVYNYQPQRLTCFVYIILFYFSMRSWFNNISLSVHVFCSSFFIRKFISLIKNLSETNYKKLKNLKKMSLHLQISELQFVNLWQFFLFKILSILIIKKISFIVSVKPN